MSYVELLAKALSIQGYTTTDLRQVQQPALVPLREVMEEARRKFSLDDPAWDSIATHLLNLSHLGVTTVAIKAHEQKLRVVALRPAPSNVSVAKAALTVAPAMGHWADALSDLLPKFKTGDERMASWQAYANWVGDYAGSESVQKMAGKLLYLVARANAASSCVTVHPVQAPASQELLQIWATSDLTKEYVLTDHVHTANYLWEVGAARVSAGDTTNTVSFWIEPDPADLAAVLMAVGD